MKSQLAPVEHLAMACCIAACSLALPALCLAQQEAPPAAAEPGSATTNDEGAAEAAGTNATSTDATNQTTELSAEDVARDRAREAYGRGEAAFTAGDFEAALLAFEEAYRIIPNPVVLRSIAHAERRMGRLEDAIAHLRAYLEAAPQNDPMREDVAAEITALSQVPATLALRSKPMGATVRVDGRQEQATTPGELELPAGDYTLIATLEGQQEARVPVTLAPGVRKELEIAMQPQSSPAVVDIESNSSSNTAALWITGGVGIAGMVAGSVFGFMSLAERSKYDDNPTQASADRGERYSLFSDVSFGVGASALLTCLILYFTDDADVDEADNTAGSTLQLGLAPAPGGAYANASLRY